MVGVPGRVLRTPTIDCWSLALKSRTDEIRAGSGAVLYGGPKHVFDRLRPVLDAMGGQPSLVCDRPADMIVPTNACYVFLFSALLSFLQGAAVCHRGGVPVESFMRNVIKPIRLIPYFEVEREKARCLFFAIVEIAFPVELVPGQMALLVPVAFRCIF